MKGCLPLPTPFPIFLPPFLSFIRFLAGAHGMAGPDLYDLRSEFAQGYIWVGRSLTDD